MESEYYYPNLEVRYILTSSWEIFRANMGIVFGIVVVQILIVGIASFIPLLPLLITGPLAVGCNYALLRLVRGEDIEIRDVFDGFKEFGRSLGVYWLYGLSVMVGLILLVVPGIVVAVGLIPATYLVLDAEYGVTDTLRESWEMTRGYKGSLFLIVLAIIGLSLIGLLAFVIGALFVAVYAYVVMAKVYDELARGRVEA